MKRFELTRDPDDGRLTFIWEADERLSAHQKFTLWAMAIIGTVLAALTCLVGAWALLLACVLGFVWLMSKTL